MGFSFRQKVLPVILTVKRSVIYCYFNQHTVSRGIFLILFLKMFSSVKNINMTFEFAEFIHVHPDKFNKTPSAQIK
jgi:hypothetical protein